MKKHLFIPQGDDRQETASILVGTAEGFDISTRDILSAPRGFWVTERLADLLVDEGIIEAPEPEADPAEAAEADAEAPEAEAEAEADAEAPEAEAEAEAEPKKKGSTKKTSGNRAAKNNTDEEGV